MSRSLILPTIIEVAGIIMIAIGIGIEISKGAKVGFVLITVGSVVVAAGALIHSKLI